ncbi:RNA-directed DNA polymerase, eukaryota, reverse transcriptase zinc-binding domain protein [Tanacetum coccineum]
MAVNELRYNLRRMWSRHGFKDIVDYNNRIYFMKFHYEAGIDFIVNNGPWMVKNKPLIVQQWDINMYLDKREPEKIPLWIKMCNVPLEAWTVNGISALASRVGKPLVMDNVTASMCKVGVGRIGFARVLVEVDAKKALSSEIEMVYKNSLKEVVCKNSVIVCYDWKPPVCSTCCVFGHTLLRCGKSKSRSNADNIPKAVHKEMCNEGNEIPKNISNKVDNEGFTTVHNRKNRSMNEKFRYQPKKHNDSQRKQLRRLLVRVGSANKFTVLEMYDENEEIRNLNNERMNKGTNVSHQSEEDDVLDDDSDIAEFGSWNIRGFSTSDKLYEIRNFIRDESLSVCAILETHIKSKRLQDIRDRIFGNWEWYSNMQYCDKGCRIMLGWNGNTVDLRIIHSAKQSMLCEIVSIGTEKSVFCTFIYAANGGMERRALWKDLQIYKSIVDKKSWVLLGDMNVTLAPNEHSAGGSRMTSDMEEFKDCVNNIEVEDITSSGNEEFIDKFSKSHDVFHPYLISDHCPSVLVIPNIVQKRRTSFKFINLVADKEDFLPIIRKQWDEEHDGCHMFRTVKKLKSLKRDLKKLAWKDGNIFENVKQLRDQLKDIPAKIDKEPNKKELRIDEAKILEDYVAAMKDEEKLLCQKAKVKWLSEGDRNNTFFYKVLKSRSHKSKINKICDDLGNCYTEKDVVNQFVKHFESFLGNDSSVTDLSTISALFQKKLSMEEAQFMVREKAWNVVGSDVCNAIKEFFASGKLLKEINSTLISLVPKIQTPCKVNDFRPIACCNVIYKCIRKIITDRMKESLGMLVDQNQSVFVPNRHIQDNILLSQEFLRGYDRKEGPNRVAMKVDIQKAYDTVNWQFLEVVLMEIGFHEKMVGWIVKYVTSVSFSICVNGERFGYFKGGRGLRQGDPMSSYLITLVMEVLTLIVKDKVEKNKNFRFHFGCKKLKLTHVCFVDGLLTFCNGDMESVKTLKEAIKEFGAFSGLKTNYSKSTIIFGSMNDKDKQNILEFIPFKVERLHVRYLGDSLSSKRIGVSNCKVLLDKVKGRISNWKNKYLSYAGRLQLIASVLESIHVYWASMFLLPLTVINDINKILKDFLWNHGDTSKGNAKNILKLRNEVRSNFVMKIGNGEKVSVVYDNCSDIGILQSFISQRDIYDARLNANVVVKDFVSNGVCKWPNEWICKFLVLSQQSTISLDEHKEDKLVWRSNNGKEFLFPVKQAYEDLSCPSDIVKWKSLDKVRKWGSYDVMRCPLCRNDIDSHDHLFFQCHYAAEFWQLAKNKMGLQQADMGWNEMVDSFSEMNNGNSVNSIIIWLGLVASVYLIWKERNYRIFKDEKKSCDDLAAEFYEVMRLRLSSLRAKLSKAVLKEDRVVSSLKVCVPWLMMPDPLDLPPLHSEVVAAMFG